MRKLVVTLFFLLTPFLIFAQSDSLVMVAPFDWDSVEISKKYLEISDYISDNFLIENNLIKMKNISVTATEFNELTLIDNDLKLVIPSQYIDYGNPGNELLVENEQLLYVFVILNNIISTSKDIIVKKNYIRFNNDQQRTVYSPFTAHFSSSIIEESVLIQAVLKQKIISFALHEFINKDNHGFDSLYYAGEIIGSTNQSFKVKFGSKTKVIPIFVCYLGE